ncbi:hypothetical protein ACFL9T_20885, partial [Thermodesulfobacteriota bacterium]
MAEHKGNDKIPPVAEPILLLRTWEGDDGQRPLTFPQSGSIPTLYPAWSPDIRFFSSWVEWLVLESSSSIRPGTEYKIQVRVTNIGMLPALGTCVEVFERDPSCTSIETLSEDELRLIDRFIINEPIVSGASVVAFTNSTWVPGDVTVAGGVSRACITARAYVPIFGLPQGFDNRVNPWVAHSYLCTFFVVPGETVFMPVMGFSGKDRGAAKFTFRTVEPME